MNYKNLVVGFLAASVGIAGAESLRYVEPYKDSVIEELKAREKLDRIVEEKATGDVRARIAETRKTSETTQLVLDVSGIARPDSPEAFHPAFHFPPVSQYRTGTCWCFSGTSFFESETARLTGRKIRLSEMHSVYYEYVEKATLFVRERGNPALSPGSEPNAALRMFKLHGAVLLEVYSGASRDPRHDHHRMHVEIQDYLNYIQDHNLWDESAVVAEVKRILNKYLGEPPASFSFEGKTYTPKEFVVQVLKLPLDDYVVTMSTLSKPFYTKAILEVSDNWWRSDDYINLPLEDWYGVLKNAVNRGYTAAINGDVSEPGYVSREDVAVIPDCDIPSSAINQEARELRIANGCTSDDHAIHLIGAVEAGGRDWYLIKDSSRIVPQGRFEGYTFYRDDYVRLKMLSYMIHKDALGNLMDKIK